MDYNIVVLPKKRYDNNTQTFIDYNQSPFLKSDNEMRLKDEIQSIKKLVKLKDRPDYFRK